MNTPTDEFIRVFEEICNEVNRRAGQPNSYAFELVRAAGRDRAVRKNESLLRYIRDVRNALQHPRHRAQGHAVEISPAFLAEVNELLCFLRNPPTASSLGVFKRELKTASLTDELGALANDMKEKGFSHLPILDEGGVVVGVFNEAAVFDYLWREAEAIVGRTMTIGDIIGNCSLEANHTETFEFVSPRVSIDVITRRFVALQSPTTRVGAIFVTASGKRNEALQRMITPWDVLISTEDL